MNPTPVIIVAALFLAYSLVSKYLEKTSVTAPMIFTFFGMLLAFLSRDLLGAPDMNHGTVHLLAEITLIFVLFTDASRTNFRLLRKDHVLPQRLLSIGLPLTILSGTVVAFYLLGTFSWWEAAMLAAILAPTDAALGQAVVTSNAVPVRIRQALGVESGLNDGIALPAVLILASLSGTMIDEHTGWYWIRFTLMQIGLGPLVGLVTGLIGAKLISVFVDKDLMSKTFEGISALSIALIAYSASEFLHGNGFISAFVAGLAFGHFLKDRCKLLFEFAESEGQFFTLSTFLIFGSVAVHLIGTDFQWVYVLYAVLSLTIIRMIPVAISLLGTGVNKNTILFLGWFGPRGLASILFALLILERMEISRGEQITSIVVITVILSILLHGITAAPVSRIYGEKFTEATDCEELKPMMES